MRVHSAIGSAVRTITVASGVFAPGHLGELTRVIPFELADAVLEEGGLEKRVRLLPSRTGIYFLLAMCLFPQPGPGAWGKLTAGLRMLQGQPRAPGDHVRRLPDHRKPRDTPTEIRDNRQRTLTPRHCG